MHARRERELRGQPVVHGDDDALGPISQMRAVGVLRVDAAEHPAAAVVPDGAGPVGGRGLAVRDKDAGGDAAGVGLRVLARNGNVVGVGHSEGRRLARDDVAAGLGVRHGVLVGLEDVWSLAQHLAEEGHVLRVELVHHGRVERQRERRKGLWPAVVVVELCFENGHWGAGWLVGVGCPTWFVPTADRRMCQAGGPHPLYGPAPAGTARPPAGHPVLLHPPSPAVGGRWGACGPGGSPAGREAGPALIGRTRLSEGAAGGRCLTTLPR